MYRRFIISAFASFLMLPLVVGSAGAFGGGDLSAEKTDAPAISEEMQDITIPLKDPETGKVVDVPLFSEKYRNRPVAAVNGEPITLEEFALQLATMHGGMDESQGDNPETPGRLDFAKMLDRLVAVELIRQEALNIGFDRSPSFKQELETFASKTMIQQLLAEQIEGLTVAEEKVDALYRQMAIEANIRAYRFKTEQAAQAFLDQVTSGADFEETGAKLVAANQAEGGGEKDEYVKLNDLFSNVAKAIYSMQEQEVSQIFRIPDGFMVFKLLDKRVYEDPEIRQAARRQLLEEKANEVQRQYIRDLIGKYTVFNEKALKALDFEAIAEKNPDIHVNEALKDLKKDQRPVATVTTNSGKVQITVADIAQEIEESQFHGTDRKLDPAGLNNQTTKMITSRLTEVVGREEAKKKNIPESPAFQAALEAKKEEKLFTTFLEKAVIPEIRVMEDEAREYYQAHIEEYSTPPMVKLKGLVFTSRATAEDALAKLREGSDFKWVSANATNLADPDDEDLLGLGGRPLSLAALPEDLQTQVADGQPGDVFLYTGEDDLFYTLVIEQTFPSQAKDYQEVREDIGGILYARKIQEALDVWIFKLKNAYDTEVYLVQNDQES